MPTGGLGGGTGAGKSFTLRRLVIYGLNQPDRIPVFVPLNAFKGDTRFDAYIRQQMGDLAPYYRQLSEEQRLVLICDALNEMPRTGQLLNASEPRELLPEVREVLSKAPRFVVSCRVRDYQNDLDTLALERLEVRELELPAIREFIHKYLREQGETFWQRIGGSEDLLTFWTAVKAKDEPDRFWQEHAGVPTYTSISADNAWERMWQGAKLIPLARNPYLARVICSLHRRQQLPNNRAELYQAFVADLYEREQKQATARGQAFPSREDLEHFLTDLANRMQSEATTVLKQTTIASALLPAALDATILTLEGDDLRFTHQLLQEYFAAKTLALKLYADADPRPLFGKTWWQSNVWRETALMLAEFTGEPERVGNWIGRASPWLALETLERFGVAISPQTQQILIDSAEQKRTEANPIGRAAAYRVLGKFDADHRDGIGIKYGLPDLDWVEIPSGEFIYQADQTLYLPTFQMTRYPITYRQFQAFIDAPDGFYDEQWWDGLADNQYRRNNQSEPGEQAFKFSNHPRENVSWYDAIAFCRWLSFKLGGPFALDDVAAWKVRLPTEFEWEKAARGTDGRIYPYEGEFDANKGNTAETGIGMTSAVGIFPEGVSPYGLHDMSGNVWEWCLSDDENLQLEISHELLNSGKWRVLRGGSWDARRDFARAAFRLRDNPSYRYYDLGFRLSCPPSLDH